MQKLRMKESLGTWALKRVERINSKEELEQFSDMVIIPCHSDELGDRIYIVSDCEAFRHGVDLRMIPLNRLSFFEKVNYNSYELIYDFYPADAKVLDLDNEAIEREFLLGGAKFFIMEDEDAYVNDIIAWGYDVKEKDDGIVVKGAKFKIEGKRDPLNEALDRSHYLGIISQDDSGYWIGKDYAGTNASNLCLAVNHLYREKVRVVEVIQKKVREMGLVAEVVDQLDCLYKTIETTRSVVSRGDYKEKWVEEELRFICSLNDVVSYLNNIIERLLPQAYKLNLNWQLHEGNIRLFVVQELQEKCFEEVLVEELSKATKRVFKIPEEVSVSSLKTIRICREGKYGKAITIDGMPLPWETFIKLEGYYRLEMWLESTAGGGACWATSCSFASDWGGRDSIPEEIWETITTPGEYNPKLSCIVKDPCLRWGEKYPKMLRSTCNFNIVQQYFPGYDHMPSYELGCEEIHALPGSILLRELLEDGIDFDYYSEERVIIKQLEHPSYSEAHNLGHLIDSLRFSSKVRRKEISDYDYHNNYQMMGYEIVDAQRYEESRYALAIPTNDHLKKWILSKENPLNPIEIEDLGVEYGERKELYVLIIKY